MTLQYPFILTVLQQVSIDRLQKAVNALVDGSMAITVTRKTESEIRALVKNGDTREYGITLTHSLVTCSCKDALYRGVVCKHAVVTVLQLVRAPGQAELPVGETQPPIHLMWKDGMVLRGMWQPQRFWLYPWTDNSWNWPDICRDYQAARKARTWQAVAA